MARRSKCHPAFPPFVVFAYVAFLYYVYMAEMVFPQEAFLNQGISSAQHLVETTNKAYTISVTIFHVLLGMTAISYFRAMVTHPGRVPEDPEKWRNGKFGKWITNQQNQHVKFLIGLQQEGDPPRTAAETRSLLQNWIQFLRNLPLVERKIKGGVGAIRKCKNCNLYKPDRVHHCSQCGYCVLRMDHHCPWICNCVGFYNYKFFLLLLFYASCSLLYYVAIMFPRLVNAFEPILDWEYFMAHDLPVMTAWLLAILLGPLLGSFLIFHLYLTANSMSTIEYREKKTSKNAMVNHRWAVAHAKYDYGVWANLKHVLGLPHIWLLPINPQAGDGTYFTPPPQQRCC